jgi:hypothetical protein
LAFRSDFWREPLYSLPISFEEFGGALRFTDSYLLAAAADIDAPVAMSVLLNLQIAQFDFGHFPTHLRISPFGRFGILLRRFPSDKPLEDGHRPVRDDTHSTYL